MKTLAKKFPAALKYRAEQIEARDRCVKMARTFRNNGNMEHATALIQAARQCQRNALRIARIFN